LYYGVGLKNVLRKDKEDQSRFNKTFQA
jgi:hypothetical protein